MLIDITDVRIELLDVIQDEAWRGPKWLRDNPRQVSEALRARMSPRYRSSFSKHLEKCLRANRYQSLGQLVSEQIGEYFRLQRSNCIEIRTTRRGGF